MNEFKKQQMTILYKCIQMHIIDVLDFLRMIRKKILFLKPLEDGVTTNNQSFHLQILIVL